MQRGEVWIADLAPSRGSEADKRRPVVIVSNDGANEAAARLGRGVITCVPMTSNVARVYPFQVLVPAELSGLRADSKAQPEQIRSLDSVRLTARIGALPADVVQRLDDALRLHLGL